MLSFDHDSNEAKNEYGGFQVAGGGVAPPAAAPSVEMAAPAAAPAAAPDDAPYDIAAPRDVISPEAPQEGKPLQEGRWPTIATMSSL